MISASRLGLTLGLAATLTLGACGGDGAEVDMADTTAVDSTMSFTPADSGLPTNADSNSTAGPDSTGVGDVGIDSANLATPGDGATGAAVNSSDLANNVAAQLNVMHPDVKASADDKGVVTLTGSVASAQEKADAEAEAKRVVGVTSVKNELTVK